MIEKHFSKNCKINEIINKNNTKLSYCCMTNIENTIKNHNTKIIENPEKENEKR